MSHLSYPKVLSLMTVTFLLGLILGFFISPEYQVRMYEKTEMGLGVADRWLDLRYIDQMIAHHRGAMLVAEQAKTNSQRKEIQDLAQEILTNEPKLIAELYEWKKTWYGNERAVPDPVVPRLGTYDEQFDLRFLNTVIGHHNAGVAMTKEVRSKTSRKEILSNADAVEAFLTKSKVQLESWRTAWYSIQ